MTTYHHILQQADALRQELDRLSPLKEADEQRLWQKLRLEWNWNSNHIEGNTLTYGETKLLLLFEETTGDHNTRELDEMRAHDVAVEMIRQWARDPERMLSEANIRELNKIILVKPFWKEALTPDGQPTRRLIQIGEYKKYPNHVRLPNGELFRYAKPEETPAQMQDLIHWYRNETAGLHSLEVAAILHYRFVCIHPFDDGNGRIARLMANYHLMRSGFPPVVIKSADKKNYLGALNKADAGDLEAFVSYFASQAIWSLELAIAAAKGEPVEEDGDWKKKVELLKQGESRGGEVREKTARLLMKRVEDSFSPLFQKLSRELGRIDELFVKSTVDFSCFSNVALPPRGELFLYTYLMVLSDKKLLDQVQKIFINFRWEGYKKDGDNPFNISTNVEISWDEPFKYKIHTPNAPKKPLSKLYTQVLNPNEQEGIVNAVGAYVLEQIERNRKTD
ncbi:MAG: Fic family protein [Saprospiraceae bacterium]